MIMNGRFQNNCDNAKDGSILEIGYVEIYALVSSAWFVNFVLGTLVVFLPIPGEN